MSSPSDVQASTSGSVRRPAARHATDLPGWAFALTLEVALYGALLLAALITRFYALGRQPMQPEEAQLALAAWRFVEGQGASMASYSPPLFWGTALIFFVLFEWVFMHPGAVSWIASRPPLIRDLLNPATGMLTLAALDFTATGIRAGTTRAAVLAGIAVLLVAVIGFTLVAWCRGPMWMFFWPWEEWTLVR